MLIPNCCAIWAGFLSGCKKTLKHSARFSLHVMEGLKVITPFSCLALLFSNFHVLVRDMSSGGSCFIRSYLGWIRLNLVSASTAHLCGLVHPRVLLAVHSWQVQFLFFQWVRNWVGWQRCADILTRSATFTMLCFPIRYFALALFRDFCSVARWYHMGSCARRWDVIFITARLTLYLLAVFSIHLMSSFSAFALWPLSRCHGQVTVSFGCSSSGVFRQG